MIVLVGINAPSLHKQWWWDWAQRVTAGSAWTVNEQQAVCPTQYNTGWLEAAPCYTICWHTEVTLNPLHHCTTQHSAPPLHHAANRSLHNPNSVLLCSFWLFICFNLGCLYWIMWSILQERCPFHYDISFWFSLSEVWVTVADALFSFVCVVYYIKCNMYHFLCARQC